jgi:hypothetical protein
MFRGGQNSKAAIDVVQQDDDGAVEHFQQQAPGQCWIPTTNKPSAVLGNVQFA